MDLVSEAKVSRVKGFDFSCESVVFATRFQEAEDAAIAEKRVEDRQSDDEKRGEAEGFLFDPGLAETSRPRGIARSTVVSWRLFGGHVVGEL